MANKLTKADILRGNKEIYYEYIKEWGGEIPIKALTTGQWAHISAVQNRGSHLVGSPQMDENGDPDLEKTKMQFDIDLEKVSEAEFEADCLTVMYGTGDDFNLSLEEVKSLQPAGIVSKIAKKILKVSGIETEKNKRLSKKAEEIAKEGKVSEAKSFRKE